MSSPNKDCAVLGLVVVILEFVLGRGSAVSPLVYIMLLLLHIMFLIFPIMFPVFHGVVVDDSHSSSSFTADETRRRHDDDTDAGAMGVGA